MKAANERGIALVVTLMAMLVMVALGSALLVSAAIESRIARNFLYNAEALYAADAAIEHAIGELVPVADWTQVLAGVVRPALVDGQPRGIRKLADGRTIDLEQVLNDASCRKISGCSSAAMDAVTTERPWGANNPRWQPFMWGPARNVLGPASIDSPFYLVVMVADDPAECDDNPLVDGGAVMSCPVSAETNPGAGVMLVRAEAFGPLSAHKIIEVVIAKMRNRASRGEQEIPVYNSDVGQAGVRVVSWREMR